MSQQARVLADGDVEIIRGRGGWMYELRGTADGADIKVVNTADDGTELFFTFDTGGVPWQGTGDLHDLGMFHDERKARNKTTVRKLRKQVL